MNPPYQITLHAVISEHPNYYDIVYLDFLTKDGRPLRAFGIGNPGLFDADIIALCGVDKRPAPAIYNPPYTTPVNS